MQTDTFKKIRGSAVQEEDGIFVFTPYNQQPESEKTLKLVAVSKNGKLYVTRKKPRSLVFRLKVAENKPITLTELVRQTMYLWENGQKELKKTQN